MQSSTQIIRVMKQSFSQDKSKKEIEGLHLRLNTLNTSYDFSITHYRHCYLQRSCKVIAGKTVVTLQSIRNDESFNNFWEKVNSKVNSLASKNDINEPILPRRRKRPGRFEEGQGPYAFDQTPKDMYRKIYFEAFDLLIQCIGTRFNYQAYCCLQNLLIKAVNRKDFSSELREVITIYGDDFVSRVFRHNLKYLAQLFLQTSIQSLKYCHILRKYHHLKKNY